MSNDLKIGLTRLRADKSGECTFCPEDPPAPPTQPMLMIDGAERFIVLCEYHEGELLATLLNNYVRRKLRNSKAGFTGNLLKEAKDEDNQGNHD